MTVLDQVGVAPVSVAPDASRLPSPFRLRFAGSYGDFWRLMVRGALLQAITLGIYRFWLFTDMRRFLWAATQVDGETAEYTGTAAELLIGFLIAIGILIPIYAMFFVTSLELGILSQLSGVVAFVLLAAFGEYAAFRARRYRLSRTVFRGLRFHQTGSAIGYAVRAILWWFPIVLTLGAAWPWAVANLERYKMRNTFYGNLGGGFAGRGTRLFRGGAVIWLITIAPVVAGLVSAVLTIDWHAVKNVMDASADAKSTLPYQLGVTNLTMGAGLLFTGATFSVLFGSLLYPAYQAIVMRWWLGGLRLGGAAAASDLRIRRYYGAYLWYLLYVLLFSIVFAIATGLALALGGLVLDALGFPVTMPSQVDLTQPSALDAYVVAGVVAYVIWILGCHTIYQVVVKMRLWEVAVESLSISGYTAFDHVRARDAAASAVGEGLADALGGGGI
jgi:uncharacterized membrane protein YjgN (DUF898 family)